MKKLFLALVLLVPMPADAGDKDAKKAIDNMQGTWVMTQLTYNGRDLTEDNKTKFKLVFKGDVASVEAGEDLQKEYAKISFKLDPTATPNLVDIKILAGSQKDAVIEGIYQLKGDEFKMCVHVLGNDRPTDFAAPEGTNAVLVIMKREAR